MTTPPKPPSPLRIAVRAMVLGISLGMACFILTTLLKSQLSMLLWGAQGMESLGRILATVLEPLGSYFVAPVVAYGAGLLLTGPRWLIVATQNVTALATSAAVMAVQVGLDFYSSPTELAMLLGSLAVGTGLSGWAMKRGQQTAERRERAVEAPAPAPLASIDFSKVKQDSPQPAPVAPEAPAPVVAPESAPTPSQAAPASPEAPPVPDKPQSS